MRTARAAGQAHDCAAAVHVPVRRAQARERRHQVHAARILDRIGDHLRLRSALNELHLIAQPLDHRAADKHAALQRVRRLAADAPGDGGHQAGLAGHRQLARVHEQEAARAVGVLHHAGLEAALAEQRRVLVARQRGHRNRAAEDLGIEHADHAGGIHHLGQHRARNVQRLQQHVVPVILVDVVEHGAAGVRRVRHMRVPGDEIPRQEAVHRAEADFSLFGALVQIQLVQQPLELRAGEIRIRHQTRRIADVLLQALVAQLLDDRRGAAALPDNGIVQRPAGRAVPDHRCFTLIGDADGSDLLHRDTADANRLAQRVRLGVQDGRRIVLDPTGLRIDLLELVALHGHDMRLIIEDDGARACRALIQGDDILMHLSPPYR